MNGKKAKALRRIAWSDIPNGRNRTVKDLKAEYPKGRPIGLWAHYPRHGRDWRQLMEGKQ